MPSDITFMPRLVKASLTAAVVFAFLMQYCFGAGKEVLGRPANEPPDRSAVQALLAGGNKGADYLDRTLKQADPQSVRWIFPLLRATNDPVFTAVLFKHAGNPSSAFKKQALETLLETDFSGACGSGASFLKDPQVPLEAKLALVNLAGALETSGSLEFLASLIGAGPAEANEAILKVLRETTLDDAGADGEAWRDWLRLNLKDGLGAYLKARLRTRIVEAARDQALHQELEKRYVALVAAEMDRLDSPDRIRPYLTDPVAGARVEAVQRVKELSAKPLVGDVAARMRDADPEARVASLETLLAMIVTDYAPQAVAILERDPVPAVRAAAARYLSVSEAPAIREALVRAVRADREAAVRAAAIKSLSLNDPERAAQLALEFITAPESELREAAASTLGAFAEKENAAKLFPLLKDPSPRVRYAAADALGAIRSPLAVEPLIAVLHDPESSVVSAVLAALTRIGDDRAVEPLVGLLDSAPAPLERQLWQSILSLCERKPALLIDLARRFAGAGKNRLAQESLDHLQDLAAMPAKAGVATDPLSPAQKQRLLEDSVPLYLKLGLEDRAVFVAGQAARAEGANAEVWLAYTELLDRTSKLGELWVAYDVALGRFPAQSEKWWRGKFKLVSRLADERRLEEAGKYLAELTAGKPMPVPDPYLGELEKLRDLLRSAATQPAVKGNQEANK